MDLLVNNIEMQLAEIELLQSMYNDQEFKLNDFLMIQDLRNWLDKPDICPPPTTLSFVLHLNVDFYIKFPHEYPQIPAEIFVRSNEIQRDRQSKFNKNIQEFISETFEPDCALVTEVVSWVQDHLSEYMETDKRDQDKPEIERKNEVLGRLWLYSHHIYSKTKRKNILDLAKENSLTGFCMPGKPGIVCLEGILDVCNDVWSIIKQWNWKKINVKFQEDPSPNQEEDFLKFEKFEEIGFVKGDTRDYHMDMGEFFKYLKEHKCEHMFKELFGIEKS